jgi:hypothetical protein
MATGVAALIGGVLLAAAPDGSLLSADVAALEGSPFTDWRLPGLLLGGLVGGGFLVAGTWQWRNGWHARELNRPGNCGDSFAWKGKSNVHTEEEAHAAGEEAAAGWFPAEISA